MPSNSIKTLVIDDSALYRHLLSSVLGHIPGVEVIGTATNGKIGLEKILALKPDLISVDHEMPELDGIGLLRELNSLGVELASIMISSSTEDGARITNTALRLGAFDFALKPRGQCPEESHRLLLADLEPKIAAIRGKLCHRVENDSGTQKEGSNTDPECHIQRMKKLVDSIHHPPKIIGIGVSTGGPATLSRLLPRLPADYPCPIVLVQHMPPMFTKSLADDLNRVCALDVKEAEDGMVAKAGTILVAPGGKHMRVTKLNGDAVVQITNDPPERNCKPSVDYLFRSMVEVYDEYCMGVILTGLGDDGTAGCELLKQAGARTLTQDEASCVVYGMPRCVVEAGHSDQIAPIDQIADCLLEAVGVATTS